MNVLETIVCSANPGVEARLERMISARVEFRNRQEGCIKSWFGKSTTDESLFIFQTVYADLESLKEITKRSSESLDSTDGGLESCLIGPPLVGLFDISSEDMLVS